MICGLLGEKLGHSYSPQIHKELGNYSYQLFEKAKHELRDFLHHGSFSGLNITIPYKKAVLQYCDALSPVARRLGAVNTIVRRPDNTLIGHNTDYTGFTSMVRKSGLKLSGKKVLVLGSGGASATVTMVLADLGAIPIVISRTGVNNYQNLELHADATAIVNTTPVGMYPDTGESPIDLSKFPVLEGVLDLIYNPSRTKLILDATDRGLVTENGLWMLIAQAKESAEWFLNHPIDDQHLHRIYAKLSCTMENIILIGMPGSGKSTVGRLLAEALHRPFIDTDQEIVVRSGKSISDIFKHSGESEFRKIESETLKQLCKESGTVIATGGGCVTRQENLHHLRQNGRIIWLQRDLRTLATDGRPLSQSGSLQQMYETRMPLYRAFSDYSICNNTTPEQAVAEILAMEAKL